MKAGEYMRQKNIHWESLPDVLAAQDIADIFSLSRRRVYELLELKQEHGGIPSYRIGASVRADKEDVKLWKEQLKVRNN